MNKYILYFLCALFPFTLAAQGPYAPAAGLNGSTAIHKDSSDFVDWAINCDLIRGLKIISDSSFGFASVGSANSAIGKAGENGVVSLGDGGIATLEFNSPIIDATGFDFAVFENSFSANFLELAFVEVSSDGINFFRFPAHSLTDTSAQIGTFDLLDPTQINNLAGKYQSNYGTPFDLSEIPNTVLLNKQSITHVRIIDVVGSINPLYASYDTTLSAINDPFPTNFPSSGFDLDGVGAIHSLSTSLVENELDKLVFYPNPVVGVARIKILNDVLSNYNYQLFTSNLELIKSDILTSLISFGGLESGIYFLKIWNEKSSKVLKVVKL